MQAWQSAPVIGEPTPAPAPQPGSPRTPAPVFRTPPSARQQASDVRAQGAEARANEAAARAARAEGRADSAEARAQAKFDAEQADKAAKLGEDVSGRVGTQQDRLVRAESLLKVLGDLRGMAKESLTVGRFAGGVSGTPVVGALLGQNRTDLEGSLASLEGDIIQQIAGEMADANEGGVSKLLDNPEEQRRAIASIANLDPNQSLEQFLKGLDRAENFIRRRRDALAPKAAEGQPTKKQEPDQFSVGGFTPKIQDLSGSDPTNKISFEANVSEMLRRGASAELVTAYSNAVGRPIVSQRELKQAVDAYRQGYTGPINSYSNNSGTLSEEDIATAVRGAGDAMAFNFADEATAAAQSAFDPNLTYEQAWEAQQADRALDNPGVRQVGQLIGVASTLPLSLGARLLQAPTLRGQVFRGSALGAGLTAAAGVGAAPMGDRTQTLGQDLLLGAGVGGGIPIVLRGAQAVGGGVRNLLPGGSARQANEALGELQITPEVLRQRAAEFQQVNGRGPRLAEILDPSEAQRLQRNLAPSDEAVARAVTEADDATRALPGTVSNRVAEGGPIEGPAAAAQRTREQGDIDFTAIRDVPAQLGPQAQLYLKEAVLPQTNLSALGRAQAEEAIDNGAISLGLLDTMRKGLRARDARNPGEGYGAIADELQQFMAEIDPRAAQAIDRYARNAVRSEAVELGQKAVRPTEGVNFPEQVAAMRYAGPDAVRDVSGEITEGLSLGARSAAYRDALASPRGAYRLIQQLDESPALRQDLTLALGEGEAAKLVQFAEVQRRAVDNLSALSGVPANQVASQLDDAKALVDTVVAGGRGAGGAMVSGMAQRFARGLGLGQGPARKLAEKLFEPGQYEATLRALEKRSRRQDRGRVAEIVRDQLIRNFAQGGGGGQETARESYRQQLER
jgi:hypothetical protein